MRFGNRESNEEADVVEKKHRKERKTRIMSYVNTVGYRAKSARCYLVYIASRENDVDYAFWLMDWIVVE